MTETQLPSEKVVLSSPLSYSGMCRRVWPLTKKGPWYVRLITVPSIVVLIILLIVFITVWYLVVQILVGPFFFGWRLFRRSQRRERQEELRHQEMLDALK